jgi:hypothetical protein
MSSELLASISSRSIPAYGHVCFCMHHACVCCSRSSSFVRVCVCVYNVCTSTRKYMSIYVYAFVHAYIHDTCA